ncbi:MAG: hypothetical protein ROO70_14685 [Labrenzia sp.]
MRSNDDINLLIEESLTVCEVLGIDVIRPRYDVDVEPSEFAARIRAELELKIQEYRNWAQKATDLLRKINAAHLDREQVDMLRSILARLDSLAEFKEQNVFWECRRSEILKEKFESKYPEKSLCFNIVLDKSMENSKILSNLFRQYVVLFGAFLDELN